LVEKLVHALSSSNRSVLAVAFDEELRGTLDVARLFHFLDVSVAKAFVERFACGLAVVQRVERETW